MYNLIGIVDFPTRINHTSASTIDYIFIEISRFEDYLVIPVSNYLSDHDAQILIIKIPVQMQSDRLKIIRKVEMQPARLKIIRKVDKHTILDFIYKLSNESWDSVFNNNDVNLMFNSFLNTYLRIFIPVFLP